MTEPILPSYSYPYAQYTPTYSVVELVTNGSFEASSWGPPLAYTLNGVSSHTQNLDFHTGDRCLDTRQNTGGTLQLAFHLFPISVLPVDVGAVYKVSFWLKALQIHPMSRSVGPIVYFYNPALSYLGSSASYASVSSSDSWSEISANFSVPSGAAYAGFGVLFTASSGPHAGSGTHIRVDDLGFTRQLPEIFHQIVQSPLPLTENHPTWTDVSQGGYLQSGKQAVVRLRQEETRKVSFFATERETADWLQFHRGVGFRGKQFHFLTNQYMGMQLTFQNTIQDTAGGNPTSYTAAVSYTQGGDKLACVPTSGQTAVVCWGSSLQAPGGELGGTVVLTFVPLFPIDSAATAVMAEIITEDNIHLYLAKTGGQPTLQFNINPLPTSVHLVQIANYTWTASTDVITLVAKYTTMSLTLWASRNGAPFQVSTVTATIGPPFTMLKGSGQVSIGASSDKSLLGPLKILHFATYRYPFDDPTILSSYFLVGRNYYNKAELVDRSLDIQRVNPGVDLYSISMTLRQGL